ncbi:Derlin [Nannochloropsis gaditana]|uniref:Derlin n=1 Tax=Nannochloropsis gaditana TaxID=72520 RepID=W7U7J3_9STRA|nr:Derlin [Nannochloropsis gaditana]
MGALAGFVNAPVTKGYCLLVVGASLLSSYTHSSHTLRLDTTRILRKGELWRLFTSQIAFQEHPQTVLGVFLLYTFRHFERQMGSRKFGSFLVLSTLLATSTEMAIAGWLGGKGRIGEGLALSPGPFGVVYALFVLFYTTVPKLHPRLLRVCGADLSDKSMYYAVGAQLLLGGGWKTAIPALCGLFAGILYRRNVFGMQSVLLPQVLCRGVASVLEPLLQARRPTMRGRGGAERRRRRAGMAGREQLLPGGDRALGRGGGGGREGGQLAPPPPPPPASEDAIQMLMGLGFERGAVVRALQGADNNVEVAANRLLQGA